MRGLMWFALGVGAASLLCSYELVHAGVPLAAGLLLLALGFAAAARKRKQLRRVAVLCLGAAIGFLWFFGFSRLYLDTAQKYDGQTCDLSVQASDYAMRPNTVLRWMA